jgi:hypothetical protein
MPQEKPGRSWSMEAELAFVLALGTHRLGALCTLEAVPLSEHLTLLW